VVAGEHGTIGFRQRTAVRASRQARLLLCIPRKFRHDTGKSLGPSWLRQSTLPETAFRPTEPSLAGTHTTPDAATSEPFEDVAFSLLP